MTVTWTGEVVDGKLMLDNRELFIQALSQLSGAVEIEVRPIRDRRSSKQNRYLWGVVYRVLSDHLGYTPEEIHEICKFKFNLKKYDLPNGEHIEPGGSTRGMDTAEFSRYTDEIRDWAAGDLSCYIPEPNELT